MAEKQNDIELKSGMSKKTKIMSGALAVILIAAIAGGIFWWMGNTAEPIEEVTDVKAPPIYHEITAPFIVNFAQQSNNQVRYLQIKIKVMSRDQASINLFIQHEPALIHELLMLFYSQNYDELSTTAGTQALQQATLDTINSFLRELDSTVSGLEAVYFTSLVMQ